MRWGWEKLPALCLCLTMCALANDAAPGRRNLELNKALHAALEASGAVAVVVDRKSGNLLAAERPEEAAQIASAPGSTVKPFFLTNALAQHRIDAGTTVLCRRNLRIADRDLACTHPAGVDIFNAEQALAYSCNTYFASLALRWAPKEAIALLRGYGFSLRPHLFPAESAGLLREPEDRQQQQLLVLGLTDVMASPAQLAYAYWRLSNSFAGLPVVRRGLEDSVNYGMAHNAAAGGFTIAGKTGTASDPGLPWTHGWFAGIVSRNDAAIVLVIYVPHGNGADAASLAHKFLLTWRGQEP